MALLRPKHVGASCCGRHHEVAPDEEGEREEGALGLVEDAQTQQVPRHAAGRAARAASDVRRRVGRADRARQARVRIYDCSAGIGPVRLLVLLT